MISKKFKSIVLKNDALVHDVFITETEEGIFANFDGGKKVECKIVKRFENGYTIVEANGTIFDFLNNDELLQNGRMGMIEHVEELEKDSGLFAIKRCNESWSEEGKTIEASQYEYVNDDGVRACISEEEYYAIIESKEYHESVRELKNDLKDEYLQEKQKIVAPEQMKQNSIGELSPIYSEFVSNEKENSGVLTVIGGDETVPCKVLKAHRGYYLGVSEDGKTFFESTFLETPSSAYKPPLCVSELENAQKLCPNIENFDESFVLTRISKTGKVTYEYLDAYGGKAEISPEQAKKLIQLSKTTADVQAEKLEELKIQKIESIKKMFKHRLITHSMTLSK